MKTFYSSQEIEDLARQGVRELAVDDSVVLTDLARQTAGLLGIQLVAGGRPPSARGVAGEGQLPSPSGRGVGGEGVPPLPSKPRGCQHGPMTERPVSALSKVSALRGPNPASDGKVVDDLVGLVKQMSKR